MKVNNNSINIILFFIIIICIIYIVFFNNSTKIETFRDDNKHDMSQRSCSDKSLNDAMYSYVISGNYVK